MNKDKIGNFLLRIRTKLETFGLKINLTQIIISHKYLFSKNKIK